MIELTVETLSAVAAIITALVGIGIAVTTKSKLKNEAAETISKAAISLIKPLEDRVEKMQIELTEATNKIKLLKTNITTLQKGNTELKAGILILTRQVIALGQSPKYEIPKE